MAHSHIDYPKITTVGVAVSVALLVVGVVGSWAVAGATDVPAWEKTLFFDAEVIGTLGILFVPMIFGVVLPLVE